jgi:hypothetical protein
MYRQTRPVKPDITRDIPTVLRMPSAISSSAKVMDLTKRFQMGTLMRMITDIPRAITMVGTGLLGEMIAELIRVHRVLEMAAEMILPRISRFQIIMAAAIPRVNSVLWQML